MQRQNSLLFAFFTFGFMLMFYIVLCMEWNNSSLIYKQETVNIDYDQSLWNSTSGRRTQHASRVESIQALNLKRQETIRDFCKKKRRTNEPVNTKKPDHIIVNDKLKILFCYIPKVACTQWKAFMARLSRTENQWKPFIKILNGSKTRYKIHEARNFRFLAAYPTNEAKRMLQSYFKFVFVREPFERLLSAYYNKFHRWNPYYYQQHGRAIIRRYRPGSKPEDKEVTFDEFLHHVGDGHWDHHWERYDKLCRPCGIDYDFIGKFENLEEEARHVLEISGISQKMNISFPEVEPSETSSMVPLYYSQIPKQRLYRTVQLFSGDSEMFQYDLPTYIRARMTDTD